MLQIPCPWCGLRDETEFTWGGEAGIARPVDPAATPEQEWAAYLYLRENVKGPHREQWWHAAGCRRWFVVERDTLTYRIAGSWPPGGTPSQST
jgi:heterotetrameric sarcosine oxidase delta subunit